jgi:hypothetical protein
MSLNDVEIVDPYIVSLLRMVFMFISMDMEVRDMHTYRPSRRASRLMMRIP